MSRNELRYVVAHKLQRGGWGDNEYIHAVLRCAVAFCEHFALESLLQHPLSELTTMAASGDFLQKVATGKRTGGLRNFKLALPSMVRSWGLRDAGPVGQRPIGTPRMSDIPHN